MGRSVPCRLRGVGPHQGGLHEGGHAPCALDEGPGVRAPRALLHGSHRHGAAQPGHADDGGDVRGRGAHHQEGREGREGVRRASRHGGRPGARHGVGSDPAGEGPRDWRAGSDRQQHAHRRLHRAWRGHCHGAPEARYPQDGVPHLRVDARLRDPPQVPRCVPTDARPQAWASAFV